MTPTAPTAPLAPTGVSATAGNGSATVSWTAPANGGSPITSYTVTPFIAGVAQATTAVTGNPPATSATVSGLTNGISYTFTVTATNAVGTGAASAPSAAVTPSGPTSPVLDTKVSVNATGTTATTPTFSTAQAGETLVAFTAADGPTTGGPQTMTVSGAGFTWTLASRANTQYGTAEVWSATAPAKLTGVTVSATESKTVFHQMLTVIAFQGSSGIGAVQSAGAATGTPTVSLTTTRAGSLVFGVGNDWDKATARTVGAAQTLANQWVDTSAGDTFWVQNLTAPAGPIGSIVTLNDTAPTTDRWNLAAVEIKGSAPADGPGAPTAVTAGAGNSSAVVSWTAPANGGSPITSYTVTPFIAGVAQATTAVTGNPPATSTTDHRADQRNGVHVHGDCQQRRRVRPRLRPVQRRRCRAGARPQPRSRHARPDGRPEQRAVDGVTRVLAAGQHRPVRRLLAGRSGRGQLRGRLGDELRHAVDLDAARP